MGVRSYYVPGGGLNRLQHGAAVNENEQEVRDKTPSPVEAVRAHLEAGLPEEAARAVTAMHVADGAQLLETLEPEYRVGLVQYLDPGHAAGIFEQLNTDDAVDLSAALARPVIAEILDRTSSDVAADILRGLPEDLRREAIESMERAEEVTALLPYEDETAGGLMVPDYVVLRQWMTAEDAVARLRGTVPNPVFSNYLFVLDRRDRLVGIAHLRDLVLAEADMRVRDIMDPNVITVDADRDQEECAQLMSRYDIQQLPVVDGHGHMLGVILTEDILDVLEEEATEDIMHLGSMTGTDRVLGPLNRSFRTRAPWLLLNLGTVLLAAAVITIFESTISKAAFIAAFLPMVASQGGIAGTQTMTLVTRGIALGDLTFASSRRALYREMLLGLANGVVFGLVAGLVAYLWKGSTTLGFVVAVAMFLNLIVAGFFGAAVPLALRALKLDPALGAAVVVTTFTDVAGFGFILALAAWWIG